MDVDVTERKLLIDDKELITPLDLLNLRFSNCFTDTYTV